MDYKENLENALDEFFPKGKCKERGNGLMLYATAILQHKRFTAKVREHLAYLLGECRGRSGNSPRYREANAFYDAIRDKR
jgi:hypothetical protein